MRFSIITAVRNNKDNLRNAIASLRMQTFRNYEHIIIDGASTDGTIDVIKELADEKTKWTSEPDSGIYEALNKGIKMSSGDVICLLHSDDEFAEPKILETVADVFNQYQTDSVYGDLLYVRKPKSESDTQHKRETHKVIRWWRSGEFKYKSLKFGWMPPHPAFFVKKKVYEDFGYFDPTFRIAADYEIILRFLWNKKISTAYLPKVITRMAGGGESNRSIGNIIIKSMEDYGALKKNKIPFPIFTLICKNFRKFPQFLARDL
jgi:glycosyltransferase